MVSHSTTLTCPTYRKASMLYEGGECGNRDKPILFPCSNVNQQQNIQSSRGKMYFEEKDGSHQGNYKPKQVQIYFTSPQSVSFHNCTVDLLYPFHLLDHPFTLETANLYPHACFSFICLYILILLVRFL